jgi:hypothetical protein
MGVIIINIITSIIPNILWIAEMKAFDNIIETFIDVILEINQLGRTFCRYIDYLYITDSDAP